jgi:hypothetical protein
VNATAAETGAQRPVWLMIVVWLLVVASIITWRRGQIFTGTIDVVVVAKAIVALVATSIAAVLALSAPRRRRVGGISLGFISLIAAISLLGSMLGYETGSSVILVVRILLLALTVLMLVSIYPTTSIIWTLLAAMGAVGLFASITGFDSYLVDGRLFGGIPPLAPNELSALLLPPIVGLTYIIVRRGLVIWALIPLLALMAATYATGSRTGLAVMALGIVLALLFARPLTHAVVVTILTLVPIIYIGLTFTSVLEQTVSRGQDTSTLLTFTGRTVAWTAVLSTPTDSWQWWIGQGLALKKVAVPGQYWNQQVLDSSWISSIAQTGLIGTTLLLAFVIFAFVRSSKNLKLRGLTTPLLVLIVVRSFFENGLVESSVTFTVFFTLSVLLESGTHDTFRSVHHAYRPTSISLAEPRILSFPATLTPRFAQKTSRKTALSG